MRPRDAVERFSGFRVPSAAAGALIFLHELSTQHMMGRLPRDARWQRILDRPERERGEALDQACRACTQAWPEQLEGFFGEMRFVNEPAHAVRRGIDAAQRLARLAQLHGGPWDRRTLLASVTQEMRSLQSKQWQGAFFTPWNVARATVLPMFDTPEPREEWILEPCVGGGVMLLAALDAYRQLHGPERARALTMIGVDIDHRVCQVARASLLLAGADPQQFWIFNGNSLAQPIVGRDRRDGNLREIRFHVVLTNPPFGAGTARSVLETHAGNGPLVIPDHVLYREIPRVASQPVTERDPAGASAPAETASTAESPEPGEQLRFDWAA